MATYSSLGELRVSRFEEQLFDGRRTDLPVRVAAVSLGRGHPAPLSAVAGLEAQSGRNFVVVVVVVATSFCFL